VGLEMSRGQHDIRMSDRHHNSSGRAEGTALLLGDDGHHRCCSPHNVTWAVLVEV
jgi:hypothetical protein